MKTILLICRMITTFLMELPSTGFDIAKFINYKNNHYMGGLQHWDIALDSQEISHLGNDGRIPTFNSRYRDILPLPNTRLRYPQDGYQHPWQRIETAYKSIDP